MDESFLPYAMLEPLLKPGMTGADLGRKILALTRLGRGYSIRFPGGLPLREALKHGVHIVKTDPRFVNKKCLTEPVR